MEETPEGLDDSGTVGWGEYPLDSVFVRTEPRNVGDVVKRINADRYQLDPEFQRDFVWPVDKQSRLIESCLMRIPLPVFYVAEAKDGRIVVVDGLQRLTTFRRFLGDEFALTGLGQEADGGAPHPLNGKRFSQLPVNLRERIEDTQIILYILDAKAPERARLDIFDRVNSGVPLSRQQMRNSLYNGPATRWLKAAAESEVFLRATGGSLDRKTMRDREAINRFCAFYLLGERSFRGGDMDAFLAQALEVMTEKSNEELAGLSKTFNATMAKNYELFGRHAFRKSLARGREQDDRTVINIALFDVCSVLLADLEATTVTSRASSLQATIRALLANSEFVDSITYSTNSTRQVHARFRLARQSILGALT